MLDPRERYLLLDAFRPPDGYAVDVGVGTSFTLDLEALLLAPLALAAFDAEAQDGEVTSDPIALLEATRRIADRLTLFTSAGRISVPRRYQPALAWLEDSIVEVMPPSPRGVFHPKLWLLRFAEVDGAASRYRLISTSRNLTFDRSWDTLVCLEGKLGQDKGARGDQQTDQLVGLVRDLPQLAVGKLASERTDSLRGLASELEMVQFQDPPATKGTRFLVLGAGRTDRWPFESDVSSLLVVSPFVTGDLLSRLPPAGRRRLVSRSESLDALGANPLKGWDTYVMSAAAGDIGDVSPDPGPESPNGAETPPAEETSSELAGLHAKVFALSKGSRARLLTGSANATSAGFGDNVEVLIEFEGSTTQLGPDAVWGDASGGLAAITEPYTPPDVPIPPPDEWEVERELDAVLAGIASLGWQITVQPAAEELYDLELATAQAVPSTVDGALRCWLLSIGQGRSCPIAPGQVAAGVVAGVSLETISPYLVVELTRGKVRARSVVNATLLGDPPDRRQRVLSSALGSQTAVIRYLLFLLSGLGDDVLVDIARRLGGGSPGGDGEQAIPVPLFEALVRALSRDPSRIDIVQRLVADLSAAADGKKLLPDGFEEVWNPIWEARVAQTQ